MRSNDGQLETQVSMVKKEPRTPTSPQQGGRSLVKPFWGITSTLHAFPDNQSPMVSSFLKCREQRTASLAESDLPCSWEWPFH